MNSHRDLFRHSNQMNSRHRDYSRNNDDMSDKSSVSQVSKYSKQDMIANPNMPFGPFGQYMNPFAQQQMF
jgi:hypothetical protein